MNKIRYLLIMTVVLLIGSITCQAQDDFNPAFPAEPGAPGTELYFSRIVLLRNIDDAGSVSGAGRYAVDKNVTVYAYCNTGYNFVNWTDTKGNVLSKNSSFTFLNTEKTDTLIANYVFNPSMPSEPAEPSTTLYYRLVLKDTQGLTVSGGGRYLAGTGVTCYAYVESGYTFLGWYRNDGTRVSGNTSFTYTMPVDGDTLTAKCTFDPSLPSEPGDPILKHNLTVTCSEGGYWHGTSGRILEGTSFSLSAYRNDGYDFKGWYLNGELYTTLSSFSYTMGKENLNFYAKFEFNPGFPSEPMMPDVKNYQFYLMTVNGKPGDVVKYPIMLVNSKEVKDILIRLTFPADMKPNLENFSVSKKAVGYTVALAEAVDTISIIEEGAQLWDFSMIGGTVSPGTDALLTFDVAIPDTMSTGGKHQVKINQISLVNPEGESVTAKTRNGRIGVYRLGDVNGDNKVSIGDIVSTIAILGGSKDEELVPEVGDTNNDGTLDVNDIKSTTEMINQ